MRYRSTRSDHVTVSASQAILSGIAPDGGLFIPEILPQIPFQNWQGHRFQETAEELFAIFLTDFSRAAIRDIVEKSYGDNFDDPAVTPLHSLEKGIQILELWHGPTLAFKDIALQALPHLFSQARRIQGIRERFLILTATSGDTGKAAMAAFEGTEDCLLAVFYPDGGVSELQEIQMLTKSHPNVQAFALMGNFDDCQREVKKLMRKQDFLMRLDRHSLRLTSANSINIGRLIPQMVYYIQAYFRARPRYGQPLSVIVPAGNAGNVLAARYVKAMGLPLGEIRLVSNSNRVLFDFLKSGHYDARRELVKTSSPSMDILTASNMERYLHLLSGDARLVSSLMEELQEEGHFHYDREALDLAGGWTSEEEVKRTIRETFMDRRYLIDPHTAVALASARAKPLDYPVLVVSTASPYKFGRSVLEALGLEVPSVIFDQIRRLHELAGGELPRGLSELSRRKPGPRIKIGMGDMRSAVLRFIEENHEKH